MAISTALPLEVTPSRLSFSALITKPALPTNNAPKTKFHSTIWQCTDEL